MRVLTTQEVAAEVKVSSATIQRYARDGRVPFDTTPGGHRRFDLEEVRAALGSVSSTAIRPEATVVVLTALGLECDAVINELASVTPRRAAGGTRFYEGMVAGEHVDWRVAIAEIGEGNLGAAAEASLAIDHYQPGLVMFVGVAGSLKKDIGHGAVVVASKVYQYQSGKDAEDMLTRPIAFTTDHSLEQLARQVKRGSWSANAEVPQVEIKPIAAGELVLANSKSTTAELIRTRFNDAAAVDMESAGVYQAAHRAGTVPAIAIRGISDMLDNKDSDNDQNWQPIAAANAARFAIAMLERADPADIKTAEASVDVQSEVDELLMRLPPPAADYAVDESQGPVSLSGLRLLADPSAQPAEALDAAEQFLLKGPRSHDRRWYPLLAEFARSHSLHAEARRLFERAASVADRAPLLLISAGLSAVNEDDIAGARAFFERSLDEGPTDCEKAFAEMLIAHADLDNTAALKAGEALDTANTTAQLIRSQIMLQEGDLRGARDLIVRLVREHPRALAGLMLQASTLLVQARMNLPPEEGEQRDLSLAFKLALEARDQRREWGGDSSAAAVLAARAAGLMDDLGVVLRIARQAPDGDATLKEAADSELNQMACFAALQSGNPSLARTFLAKVEDEQEAALIDVACRELEGGKQSGLEQALKAVATDRKSSVAQRVRAQLHLARLHALDEELISGLGEIDAELAEIVRARVDLLAGNSASARRRLIGIHSEPAISMMAEVSLKEGRVDDAALRFEERFMKTGNPTYLADAAETLLGGRQLENATQIVLRGLGTPDVSRPVRRRLRLVAVQAYADLNQWQDVQIHARAVLAEEKSDDVAWALVFALHNQRELGAAFAAMVEHELVARSENEALCALFLWRQSDDMAVAIDAALGVSRRFPESEQVVGVSLMAALHLSSLLAESEERDDSISSAIAEISDQFFERWPESDIVWRVTTESPEDLIAHVRDRLAGARTEELDQLIMSAARGALPLAMASAVTQRPLTEVVVAQMLGSVLIGTADAKTSEAEVIAAAAALDAEVVADVHAFAVMSIDSLPISLPVQFSRIRTSLNVLDDVLDGADRLKMRSTGSLGWDESKGQMRFTEISEESAERFAQRSLSVAEATRSSTVSSQRGGEPFEDPRLGVIQGPIELARQLKLPFWCDDPSLRAVARADGVSAFGTVALLEVLKDRGIIDEASHHLALFEIVDSGFDPILPYNLLRDYLAESDAERPRVQVLSRWTTWRQTAEALQIFHESLPLGEVVDHEKLGEIVALAAHGAASRAEKPKRAEIAVSIALSALFRSPQQVESFPQVLKAARQACAWLEVADDPLLLIAQRLQEAFESEMAPDLAARVVLGLTTKAEPSDRTLIARSLLS